MCNLSKGIEEKGIAIGLERGMERGIQRGMERGKEAEMLRAVQSLMETLHLSAEQAMAALKISETEQKKLISMLYS